MPKGPGQDAAAFGQPTAAAPATPSPQDSGQAESQLAALQSSINQRFDAAQQERQQIRDSIASQPTPAVGAPSPGGKGGGTEASGGLAQHAQQTNQAEQDAAAEEQRRLAANPYGNISLPDFSSPGSFSIGGK